VVRSARTLGITQSTTMAFVVPLLRAVSCAALATVPTCAICAGLALAEIPPGLARAEVQARFPNARCEVSHTTWGAHRIVSEFCFADSMFLGLRAQYQLSTELA
jgi:hypothetical protein